jgi:hypothetical protein
VGSQVVSWAGDIHNGGLPNGNCIVVIQNNCQENLVGNIGTIENSPLGPMFRSDPFVADAFDFAKCRAGEKVTALQAGFDVVGTALVFSPTALLGSIPARIAGPVADNWAVAANLWNNRQWIGLGVSVVRSYVLPSP